MMREKNVIGWLGGVLAVLIAMLAFGSVQTVAAMGPVYDEASAIHPAPSAPNAPDARLQLAHLAPFDMDPNTVVTVTLNGTDVLTDVAFADSTGYLNIPPGDTQVQIFAGADPSPAISVTAFLTDAVDFTAVAVGGANGWPLELKLLVDDNTAPTSGFAKVRIGHLAPFAAGAAAEADVRLQDGTILPGFDDVPYGTIASYIELPAGTYDLKITSADGSVTLIDPMPVTLADGDIVSVFAVGDGTNQPVGAFALPSGVSGGLLDLAAGLQVAHLAPFAADPGTAVTVTLNGVVALTDVEFADSTGYLPVPAGSTQVQIFPGASTTPAITLTGYLTHAVDFTAVAVGGANAWPLDLKLLVDDNTAPSFGFAKVRIGHLAPFAAGAAAEADVRLQDGTILPGFDDVPYDTIASHIPLPVGTYDLKITSADGSVTLIDLMPVTLANGDIVSVFAVGDGTNQPVGAFALPSGAPGDLLDLAANLQVAHLAPFAADPGTAVTVTLNGEVALTDVEFADSTGYLSVLAGSTQVQIFPGASTTSVISVTAYLTHAVDFTAVAVGGANGWLPELKLLVDDNTTPTTGHAKVRIGHLAPFAAGTAAEADVRLQDGTILPNLDDVAYGTIALHTELPAGTYDLKITSADGATDLIDPFPFDLVDGQIASLFAVGDGVNQPVGMFLLPSGAPGTLLPIIRHRIIMPIIFKMYP